MKRILSICLFLALAVSLSAEYNNPQILSFENGTDGFVAGKNSKIKTCAAHYKHGHKSLYWQWNKAEASISIKAPIAYERVKTVNTDNSLYSFVFWLYLEQAMPGTMRFEFLKQGRVCCYFDYGLNYRGWSGAWLAFKRDMQGKPEPGMDELRITAPEGVIKGNVFLDHVILSSLQDSRHHTADLQAPYINAKTDSHWLVLLRSWNAEHELALPTTITDVDRQDLRLVMNRMDEHLMRKKAPKLEELRARYAVYHLSPVKKGKGHGLPIFFERYGETYEHWDRTTSYTAKIGEGGLSKANSLLQDLAWAWHNAENEEIRDEVERMFVRLAQHMLDQGFRAGSGLGTLHHLGYSMRYYYPAMYLMREPLREAGLLEDIQQSMEWFSGVGEVKHLPTAPGMDIDAFNTSLEGRLMSILLMPDTLACLRYLDEFAQWVDNGFRYSDGLQGSFKPDGTIFHHCNHYPAYAVGGLNGAVNSVWFFHHTRWAVSRESHEILKQSLLAMRTYCNTLTWPLSLSGRHPDGKGHLMPHQYGLLSICGSPDGTHTVDKDLAQAYLRLTRAKGEPDNGLPIRRYQTEYKKAGIAVAEEAPQGDWTYPYSCLLVHRRDNWMVAVKGHSRYIWNTETYEGCNLYGRYLNYGNVAVLGTGETTSMEQSGFHQEGFDWAHHPGTTATVLPVDSLRAAINNLDNNSGFEEMLQSDESFCNGLSMDGQGVWGMKLHSHDKYDGTLRARKSVFCFDNRIICLGSDIESGLDAETHTTLFQVYTPQPTGAKTYERAITDAYGNWYILRDDSNLVLREGQQVSRHEETDKRTEGRFRMAAINHGVAPKKAGYEYVILVQPETVGEGIAQEVESTYEVLRCDSMAHIVRDKQTGITAYVLWEPGAALDNSAPCLVMTCPSKEGLRVVVSDPDLHLYEGPSDERYDANGKRKERIIYSYPWKDSPSAQSTIQLTIRGKSVEVHCQHGMSSELLIK